MLSKLLLKSYVGPFAITFVVFMFILMMQSFWLYLDELLGRGLEWYIVLEFLFYSSAALVEFALPLAILLSSTMTFGNLAEHNELVAIKSTGTSFLKASRPLIGAAIVISMIAFYFGNNLSPLAAFKMQVLRADILNKKPTFGLNENRFYTQIDGLSIRVGKKNGEELQDVTIYQYPLKGSENNKRLMPSSHSRSEKKSIRAKKGHMLILEKKNMLVLQLEDGEIYEEVDEAAFKESALPFQRYKFKKTTLSIPLEGFELRRSSEEEYGTIYKFLTLFQLNNEIDSVKASNNRTINNFANDLFNEFSDSTSTEKISDYSFKHLTKENQKRTIIFAVDRMRSKMQRLNSRRFIIDANSTEISKIHIEKHRKFVLSISCILLFFIGAPMGAIVRKGGLGMPVVITVIFFLVYYILVTIGEEMALENAIPISLGMWLSSIILAPIAFFLTYKANNDSKIFDKEFYLKLLRLKK